MSTARLPSFSTTDVVEAILFGSDVAGEFGELAGSYGVSLPTLGTLDLTVGAHEFRATPDTAAVVVSVGELQAAGWASPDDRLDHLKFDGTTLEAELSRILGVDAVGEIRFPFLMDLRSGHGAEWERYAHLMFASLEDVDGLTQNALFASRMASTLMTGLLFATEHQYRDALESSPRPLAPAVVRRARRSDHREPGDDLGRTDSRDLGLLPQRSIRESLSRHVRDTPVGDAPQ